MTPTGLTVVVVKDATQNLPTPYRTTGIRKQSGNRDVLINPLMRTSGVIVSDIVPHHPMEMRLVENQELIQTLFTG